MSDHSSAVECGLAKAEIVGSNPTGRSNELEELLYARYVAVEAIDKDAAENDLKLSLSIGCWE